MVNKSNFVSVTYTHRWIVNNGRYTSGTTLCLTDELSTMLKTEENDYSSTPLQLLVNSDQQSSTV